MEFEVKDRVAVGDNKYILTDLGDGRVQLDTDPDTVEEEGTPINKELLQPIVDAVPVVFELARDAETNSLSFQNGQTAGQLVALLAEKRNVIVRAGGNLFYNILYFVGKITTPVTPQAYIFQSISSTSTVTYTLTENGFSQGTVTTTADYVIEEGSTDDWTYRKWASGVAECWGNASINNYSDSRSLTLVKTLPVSFATISSVQLTDLGQAASYLQQKQHNLSYEAFSNNQLTLMAVFDDGGVTDGQSVRVSIDVKGRWQ